MLDAENTVIATLVARPSLQNTYLKTVLFNVSLGAMRKLKIFVKPRVSILER